MRWSQIGAVLLLFVGMTGLWNGACGPDHSCTVDGDCAADYTCQTNSNQVRRCILRTCTPACGGGLQCISGQCVEIEGATGDGGAGDRSSREGCVGSGCPCIDDGDCSSALTCVAGRCAEQRNETGPDESSTGDGNLPEEATSSEGTPDSGPGESTPDLPTPEGEGNPQETSNPDRVTPEEAPPTEMTPESTTESMNMPEGSCQQNSDCPSGQTCDQGTCKTPPPVPCMPACPANQQCVSGSCVSEPVAGIGQECSAQMACAQGLECVDLGNRTQRCFEPCSSSQDCNNNTLRTSCYFLGGMKSYCVQEARQGQNCGLTGKIQALCDPQTICQEGICQVPTTVQTGELCGVQGKTCPMDHFCLRFRGPNNTSVGYCMKECVVASGSPQGNCASGFTCERLGSTGTVGYCLPQGTAQADELCGGTQGGNTYDPSGSCGPGLSCVGLARPICLPFAEGTCANSGIQCASGRKCNEVTGGSKTFSICSQICNNGMCDKSYLACRSNNNTCWPTSP